MSNSPSTFEQIGFDQKMLSALRLGAVFLAVYLCYQILAPFISLVLWGAIIAVAIYPLHQKLAAGFGNRVNISATLITLLGLIILILQTRCLNMGPYPFLQWEVFLKIWQTIC